jgi:oligoribonuclease NrnB/cAMP/cGMP phosphodiesterase (DHH superfamily)
MTRPLCIFHAFCADGFGAAWVVRDALLGEVDFHPASYGQEPPDVTGRDVIMVDFSFKRPVLDAMAAKANSILILDHHKTAAEDLAGLPPAVEWATWQSLTATYGLKCMTAALFDMGRSGAGIAWDYFNPDKLRPPLIYRLEDRDLWRFEFDDTRAVQACVFSHPYDFEVWDQLMSADLATLAIEGEAIERKHHKDIAELVGATKRRMVIGGHDVPVANLPYTMSSDAGHLMCKGEPFAACYLDTPDGRTFSLRSTDVGMDVSAIAKGYGGGGHRNAAGFRMPIGWEGDGTPA